MEQNKMRTLEKLNKNRHDDDINPNYVKERENNGKLTQKYRKVKAKQLNDRKFSNKQKIYHKDQFIKQKKHLSRSLEVLIDPIDDKPSCSTN